MAANTDTYTVEREADIAAPADKIRAVLVDFHQWQHWSPWEGLDPAMERSYSGPSSGVGTVYEWRGNRKVGAGRMEITGDEPEEVVVALEFERPWKSKNTTTFTLRPTGDGTRVTWSMVGQKTLGTKVMGLFTSMDKLVGKDFEKGLARLRDHVGG
jgi:hypothetical protein